MQKTTKSLSFALLNQLLERESQSKQEHRRYPVLFSILILFYIPLTNKITEALYKSNEDKELIGFVKSQFDGKSSLPDLAMKDILNTVNTKNWQVLS